MAIFQYQKLSHKGVGIVPNEIVVCPVDQTILATTLSLSNKLNTGIISTVELYSDIDSFWISLVKNCPIAKGATLDVFDTQKITLKENDKIRVSCNLDNAIDVNLTIAISNQI